MLSIGCLYANIRTYKDIYFTLMLGALYQSTEYVIWSTKDKLARGTVLQESKFLIERK